MSYMAVGSRQILFADTPAPARTGESQAQVATLQDNSASEQTERIRASAARKVDDPAAPPSPGERLDIRA